MTTPTTTQSSRPSFTSIPILDLSLADGDSNAKAQLGEAMRDACERVGFFYVKNHGVSPEIVSKGLELAHVFFARPLEEKMRTNISFTPPDQMPSGYTPLLSENVNPANKGDLHEGFDIGSEGFEAGKKNQWPEESSSEMIGFRNGVEKYWNAIRSLGLRLFPILALALDLPEDYFSPKVKNPGCMMRLLHYPPQDAQVKDDNTVLGIGAHSDYECFTILAQDQVPALQVRNNAGEWVPAPYIPDTFICNLGDQLARWTNDRFLSTIHRAINRTNTERYSIPFFFGSDYDALVETIPSCITASRPAKYPPVRAGDYVKGRLNDTYTK